MRNGNIPSTSLRKLEGRKFIKAQFLRGLNYLEIL